MAETWTVRRVVAWIQSDLERRGVTSPRLEADLLVCHALGQKRIALYMDLDRPLIERELAHIRALVERRRQLEPIAYILGEREFYSRSFEVTRDVLIPRPDTETLVDAALAALRAPSAPEGALCELCVGSGAVAVTLAAELPSRAVVATDLSQAALSVATRNAERHGVSERVVFRSGDLFAALQPVERFAAIFVNPPYIRSAVMATLDADVRRYEPHLALDGGADGLVFYRRIAADAPAHLVPGGVLGVEVGFDQAGEVRALFEQAGFLHVGSVRDLSGIERVVVARRP
jgi:release factor glutamine methyltransferase